jgi:hypothetical protein
LLIFTRSHRAAGGAYGGIDILEDLLDLSGEIACADQLVVGAAAPVRRSARACPCHFGDLRIAGTAGHGRGIENLTVMDGS